MDRIVIFGNSGSGKTTLALQKTALLSCPHLDLDTVAWESDRENPVRRPVSASVDEIRPFLEPGDSWVIEGCYADLLQRVIPYSTELIFLNPGIETCIENCRSRPWEPHKYDSPEDQDDNLNMLIDWIRLYESRTDEFSLQAHQVLIDTYAGKKRIYTSNQRNT